jgi:hypothetical protein
MPNQQVIDFIHQQLSSGISVDIIKSALLSRGWTEQDINLAFNSIGQTSPVQHSSTILNQNISDNHMEIKTNIWAKVIPLINIIFMAISLVFVFVFDLMILIEEPSLVGFWIWMLIVFAFFSILFYFENYVYKYRFMNSQSNLDKFLVAVIVIRDIIVFLNFIPFIQILGMISLLYIGPFLLIAYIFLIRARFKQIRV